MTYWLKPIGTTELPLPEAAYKQYRYEIHFSKARRPSGVHVGDILLLYAVGHKCLVSYCEVISRMFESPQSEQEAEPWRMRFPYGVYAENKSKAFSENWEKILFKPQIIGDAYHSSTGLPLTRPGNEELGAIEWGHSYFALADDFARYLIAEMDKIATLK